MSEAAVILPGGELSATLAFFCDELGFRLDRIVPADEPRRAEISGHGVRLVLDADHEGDAGHILLDVGLEGRAPNGTLIEAPPGPAPMPDLVSELVLSRAGPDGHPGRAGMLYRDLIPGRQGGRFIASHISIPEGGPVPDLVHHHDIRFQLIYCRRGWVDLVYEDQGPAFRLQAGDAVLQPPHIRHRVLEASPGLEVIEVGSPATHDTWIDHEVELPTELHLPDRLYAGQRFVRHVAAEARWEPWRQGRLSCRSTGIGAATDGLAEVRVIRSDEASQVRWQHRGELLLVYVLEGSVTVVVDGHEHGLGTDDCITVPDGAEVTLEFDGPAELLEVVLPAHA